MRRFLVAGALIVAANQAVAETDNLRTCLDGRYPSICDHTRLTAEQREQAGVAERRENLRVCLSGKYPSLCKHGMLTEEEQKQVKEAERSENLRVCLAGKYSNLCNHALLSQNEAEEVAARERDENRSICLTGNYPNLCNRSLLTAEERTGAEKAENEHAERVKDLPPQSTGRGGRRSLTACEDGHWVAKKLARGEIIRLEDGSLWEIDSIDRIETALWLPTENVIICPGYLINTDSGDKVDARELR